MFYFFLIGGVLLLVVAIYLFFPHTPVTELLPPEEDSLILEDLEDLEDKNFTLEDFEKDFNSSMNAVLKMQDNRGLLGRWFGIKGDEWHSGLDDRKLDLLFKKLETKKRLFTYYLDASTFELQLSILTKQYLQTQCGLDANIAEEEARKFMARWKSSIAAKGAQDAARGIDTESHQQDDTAEREKKIGFQ